MRFSVSHEDEKAYHEAQISALEAQEKALHRRLEQIYLDKLDGKITEEFWQQNTDAWREQQDDLRRNLARHKQADRAYMDEGVKFIEFAQQAHSIYLTASVENRKEILASILSNCSLKDATPTLDYRKPYCWLN